MIDAHEHQRLTGPSAAEGSRRLQQLGTDAGFLGFVVTDQRRLLRLMIRNDPGVYPGTYVTCIFDKTKALCQRDQDIRPGLATCRPLTCRNVALTAATKKRGAELERLRARITARPRPTATTAAANPAAHRQADHLHHYRGGIVSRKIRLPTIATVEDVRSEMTVETEAAGKRPTVSELARRLGLTNATFWRHFSEIAADIAALRRPTRAARPEPADSHAARIAALTRDNQDLRANLALAIANIQRLTVENQQLREKLEQQTKIVHIPTRRSGGAVTGH
jgi:hypothetical protein